VAQTPANGQTIALVLGSVVVLFALIIFLVGRIERRAVAAAKRLLPNHAVEPRMGGHRFSGQVNGVDVTLRLFQNFSDSADGGPWTDVLLPPAPGISLELRPQDPIEAHRVKSGLARDALVGDAAFDDEFIVEMAPASLAPELFDAELRRRLVELSPVQVVPQKGSGLRLLKRHWEPERFPALIEAGALLSTRLRAAASTEAAQAERWGASHVAERAAEQAQLAEAREARKSWTIWRVALIVVGMLVVLALRLLLR
jgi:hypothetical protein